MQRYLANAVRWLVGHEVTVLLALLTVAVGSWLFLHVAGEVTEGDTQKLDEKIILAMRRPDDPARPIGPAWMADVGRDLTALGGIAVLTLVTGAVAGFLLLDQKYLAMTFVIVATGTGILGGMILKSLYDRPRPTVVPHLAYTMTSSFPSGHSMMSAVVYLTLGALLARLTPMWRLKLYFISLAVVLTMLVGCSRVYLGVHYPSDVLGGWAAGLVWATLCWLVARHFQSRGAMEAKA